MRAMARLVICAGAILASATFAAPTAHAQFTSLRRSLDVRAEARGVGGVVTIDDPPPVVRDPDFFGTFSTSAAANSPVGFMVSANITANSTWTENSLRFGAFGFSSTTSPLGEIAGASGNGQAVINVTGTTMFQGVMPVPGTRFLFNARLNDSNGLTIWNHGNPFDHLIFDFTLTPGQYTLDVGFSTTHVGGQGGSGGSSITLTVIPEPGPVATAALCGLAACGLRWPHRRR